MTTRTEKVYVLFGSQTGNSEEAAITFAKELSSKLSPEALQRMTGTTDHITLEPHHMQLDDFLEINKADWTRLVIIFVSSYGVGQAPLGCYRFRDLCDAWQQQQENNNNKDKETSDGNGLLLKGVNFALCGLGDSNYTTFFRNPTVLNEALLQVGATRIGEVGKADAKQTGDQSQAHVIQRWKDDIWQPLAEVAVKEPLSSEQLQTMQDATIALCCKINPEFEPPTNFNRKTGRTMVGQQLGSNNSGSSGVSMAIMSVIFVLLAIVAYHVLKK